MYLCYLLICIGGVVVVGGNPVTSLNKIVEVATKEGCQRFVELLTQTNLKSTLEGEGPYTVFVPTDEAFKIFDSSEDGQSASSNPERLKNILLSHILKGKTLLANIEEGHNVTPLLECYPLEFRIDKNTSSINGAAVLSADIEASNGIVNIIDKVLVPAAELSCLQQPDGLSEESSKVDIEDVLSVAEREGFNTLLDLLRETKIDVTLDKEGYFIIFAPTDEAFKAIDADSLNNLRSNPETLKDLLLSHIVIPSSLPVNLDHGSTVTPIKEGNQLEITDDESGTFVNGAPLNNEGFGASNGVIYSISKVLFLPEKVVGTSQISGTDPGTVEDLKSTAEDNIQLVEESAKIIEESKDSENKTEVNSDLLDSNASNVEILPQDQLPDEVGQISELVNVTEPKIEKTSVTEKDSLKIDQESAIDQSPFSEDQALPDIKPISEEPIEGQESSPVGPSLEENIQEPVEEQVAEVIQDPVNEQITETDAEGQKKIDELHRESRKNEEINVPENPLADIYTSQDTPETNNNVHPDNKQETGIITEELDQIKEVELVEKSAIEENKQEETIDKEITVQTSYTDPEFKNKETNPEQITT